jgi:hypothetical protein
MFWSGAGAAALSAPGPASAPLLVLAASAAEGDTFRSGASTAAWRRSAASAAEDRRAWFKLAGVTAGSMFCSGASAAARPAPGLASATLLALATSAARGNMFWSDAGLDRLAWCLRCPLVARAVPPLPAGHGACSLQPSTLRREGLGFYQSDVTLHISGGLLDMVQGCVHGLSSISAGPPPPPTVGRASSPWSGVSPAEMGDSPWTQPCCWFWLRRVLGS